MASIRSFFLALFLLASLLGGCRCNRSVSLDEVREPVAYTGRPPSGISSLLAKLSPKPVSQWGDRELMLLDAATGETWQLTSNGENDYQPVWSPSGTHLMYLGLQNWPFQNTKTKRLYVYDLKQGAIRQVDLSWARELGPASLQPKGDKNDWLDCAAWSPVDSTKIAVGVQVDRIGRDNRIMRIRG